MNVSSSASLGARLLALILGAPLAALLVTTPLTLERQLVFAGVGMLALLVLARLRGGWVRQAMMLLSVLVSTRYLYWRLSETLVFDTQVEAVFGYGLLAAECYAWVILVLGYFQIAWPLERAIRPMPPDATRWPTVDIYIPTYNESLEVVRDTVLAAQNIDYPADRMRIYVLDDGKRPEFGAFAAAVGVGYITREDNSHAKAGNLNHAMGLTDGELICVPAKQDDEAPPPPVALRLLPAGDGGVASSSYYKDSSRKGLRSGESVAYNRDRGWVDAGIVDGIPASKDDGSGPAHEYALLGSGSDEL